MRRRSYISEEFFSAGGTLRADSPSYVERPADEELFKLALGGEFCYVLTPRQMGKSSMMVRAASRLKDQGVGTVVIDLTEIGTVGVDQWYLGLLIRLKSQLRLSVDPETWWRQHASRGRVQRFTDFLRDVVLTEVVGQVVIFIDEIDTTLRLDFTDDFFAAIRAVYNARADDPEFGRLTFVLLGVATPADLIKDRGRTPFNIGQGIALQEFSQADAGVLQAGLEATHPGQGEAIFTRIYHWTSGHPYLTQKLCATLVDTEADAWDDEQVDRLVEQIFLSEEARRETNLQFIRDGFQTSPNRRRLLNIYRHVYQSEVVLDDEHSLDKSRLKLLGLVKSEGGVLQVRNEIYHRVFNLDWIQANTPVDWTRRIAVATTIIALLLVGVLGYLTLSRPQQSDEARAQAFIETFQGTTSADVRVASLAGLFQIRGYDSQARQLFFDELTSEDQAALFKNANVQAVKDQLSIVVRGTYTRLEDNDRDNRLLHAMAESLRQIDDISAVNLATEIEQWLQGRENHARGEYQQAISAYDVAINLNESNPGTHFDRALAYAASGQYQEALADLDKTAQLAEDQVPTVENAIISNNTLYTEWVSQRDKYPKLMAFVPTPTPSATPTITPTPTASPTPTAKPTPSPTPVTTPTPYDTPTTTSTWTPSPIPLQSPTPTSVAPTVFTPTSAPSFIPTELIGKIAFLSNRDDVERAYTMDPDGSNQAPLVDRWIYDMIIVRDTYSSDRRYRAYNERFPWDIRQLQVVAWDDEYDVEIPITQFGSGIAYDPAWSPVAYRIALVSTESGNEEIWTINLDGTDALQLTRNTWEWDKHPSWSPDGSQIVFFSNRTGNREIWVMNADGSNQHSLTNTPSDEWNPVWIKYQDLSP
jgi:tetratricopeptide (TPR) repeat protein